MLYQRYFLRMNQNNAVHIVWLLVALIFILTIIHLLFSIFLKSSANETCGNITTIDPTDDNNNLIIKSYLMDISEGAPNISNFLNDSLSLDNATSMPNMSISSTYELECKTDFMLILKSSSLQLSMLGLCTVLYTILLLCLYKQRINEIYLFHVSYAIILSLVAIDISFSITPQGKWVTYDICNNPTIFWFH